jgi:hypothetical protein
MILESLGAVFTVLTSGAGGGLLGGIFGIFKQSQERKERVEMARINLERDQLEANENKLAREHALLILEKGGELELKKIESESDAEIEIAHQSALSSAQDALKNLKTSTGIDNYRGSVRPTLAYWGAILFTIMLVWAFREFSNTIDKAAGKQLLLGLFSTLSFTLTSIITFYYVARRNKAPGH